MAHMGVGSRFRICAYFFYNDFRALSKERITDNLIGGSSGHSCNLMVACLRLFSVPLQDFIRRQVQP